jgi:hypothetical protein
MIGRAARYPKIEKTMPKKRAIIPVKYASTTNSPMRILSKDERKKTARKINVRIAAKAVVLFCNLKSSN